MRRAAIAGGALAAVVLLLVAVVAGYRILQEGEPRSAAPRAARPEQSGENPGFLYGLVTTYGGGVYEGRLRWGGGEEGFWGDYFNGAKEHNPWAAQVPPAKLPKQRRSLQVFGIEFGAWERPAAFERPFLARFGDIARIATQGLKVRVTLKSGTVFDLDRMEASDFDDGVRVWEAGGASVDVGSSRIRSIEFLPNAWRGAAPKRLHGSVRTAQGEFSGFLQWDRKEGAGSDLLEGRSDGAEIGLRFDTIRSIARHSRDSARVTLLDGRELLLSGNRKVGQGNRGVYVDDVRYGRVLVSWEAFERADFSTAGSGPAYEDYPPGQPLRGSVSTRAGERLTGRVVFDLDESESTDTLDAPSHGVDYILPLGLVASIALPDAEENGARPSRVVLHGGEVLELESAGDLGEGNAGLLVFGESSVSPEYVRWRDVKRIDLDRPGAVYPPIGGSVRAPAARRK